MPQRHHPRTQRPDLTDYNHATCTYDPAVPWKPCTTCNPTDMRARADELIMLGDFTTSAWLHVLANQHDHATRYNRAE